MLAGFCLLSFHSNTFQPACWLCTCCFCLTLFLSLPNSTKCGLNFGFYFYFVFAKSTKRNWEDFQRNLEAFFVAVFKCLREFIFYLRYWTHVRRWNKGKGENKKQARKAKNARHSKQFNLRRRWVSNETLASSQVWSNIKHWKLKFATFHNFYFLMSKRYSLHHQNWFEVLFCSF